MSLWSIDFSFIVPLFPLIFVPCFIPITLYCTVWSPLTHSYNSTSFERIGVHQQQETRPLFLRWGIPVDFKFSFGMGLG